MKDLFQSKFEELRKRAEDLLKQRGSERKAQFSGDDLLTLIHELEVHQIELQMQNEELRQARIDTDAAWRAYAELFEFAPIGYVALNREGMIERANRAASEMLRVSKDDLKDCSFSGFVHAMDLREYFKLILEDGLAKGCELRNEIRLLRARVFPFHAQIEVAQVSDANAHLIGWRVAFLDISERKRAEEGKEKHAKQLENSFRELQDFAFIASHDLQEPLRKIQTFSNMVIKRTEGLLDEIDSDYLKRVEGAATRMQELLQGLLKYSRVTTQSQPFTECDLNVAVRDAVSDIDLLIQNAGGKIEISELPSLPADTAQIRQLFQNLITNAMKFRRDDEPPVVKVYELSGETDACVIAVEDNGIGFEDKYADRIFAPFQRLHGASSKYRGTGMGLAICRKIVQRHGGSITARSVPGKGSTFIVRFSRRNQP